MHLVSSPVVNCCKLYKSGHTALLEAKAYTTCILFCGVLRKYLMCVYRVYSEIQPDSIVEVVAIGVRRHTSSDPRALH